MDGKRECSVCGPPELLHADGRVRKHDELRMGKQGVHRSGFRCEGSGELPESVEELVSR